MNEYILVTEVNALPVSIQEVNEQLKESFNTENPGILITAIIKSVAKFAEKYTGRDFITKTYKTYRRNWLRSFEIRKSKLQSIESVKYYKDGELLTLDSNLYYIKESNNYSTLVFTNKMTYPSYDDVEQPIVIEFKVGYGDTYDKVPEDLRLGLLNHIAEMWVNRGDNPDSILPNTSSLIYGFFQILEI